MNKFKLACFAPLLAMGISHAASVPCNGFKITIKNKLAEDLVIQKNQLSGANLLSDGAGILDAHSKKVYTVNTSEENADIDGELILATPTIPAKNIHLRFKLTNHTAICELEELSQTGNLTLGKMRLPGGVNYTINY